MQIALHWNTFGASPPPISSDLIPKASTWRIALARHRHVHGPQTGGREVTVDLRKFRHLDYGYAVTSHSAQGLTFDHVLINADTQESVRLLNDRMAYVAISRARYDALIYTDSTQNLSETLNRGIDKERRLGRYKTTNAK